MNIRNIATLAILLISLQLGGCSSSEDAAFNPSPGERQESLTASQAKHAIIELVRAHPKIFIGSPDVEWLGTIPLEDRGSGEFTFGAFVVNPDQRWYTADIGFGAPEVYSYSGSFERKDDNWIASEPEVSRLHESPDDSP